jgi:hypothetical protein
MEEAKLKIWLDFAKWFVSSVVIAGTISIMTAVITAREKTTDIQLKIESQEQAYLTQFLEQALDSDLEKRRRFAQYFAELTISDKYQQRWNRYLQVIENEIEAKNTEINSLEIKAKSAQANELAKLKNQLFELKVQIGAPALSDADLEFSKEVQSTITTADHHCENNCRGEPTRTNYSIRIKANPGEILRNPKLKCLAGPCGGWNALNFLTISDNGREARASFDVWSHPTTWRLTADSYRVKIGNI